MVSSDRPVSLEDEVSHSMKEMIGGCCVCSDERGWAENPLVYCDGHGCSVAVHQGKHPTARRPAGPETGLLPTVTVPPSSLFLSHTHTQSIIKVLLTMIKLASFQGLKNGSIYINQQM